MTMSLIPIGPAEERSTMNPLAIRRGSKLDYRQFG
jgi:hypothetical protein